MSIKLLLVFAITEFLMSLSPGPAVLLVISQGVKRGFRQSLRGTLGILAGNTIYFALSAVGLGALLAASGSLFQIIRWTGAAYLAFQGFRMLVRRHDPQENDQGGIAPARSLKLFSQGVVTQLSNPRAVVFFAALLPQFVSPEGSAFWQFVILGCLSIAVEFPVLACYGWLAERGSNLLPQRFSELSERIAGGFLIGAALGLASMRRA